MDELDRQILNTIYQLRGCSRATVAKQLWPAEKNRAIRQKQYQQVKYRIDLLIADNIITEDDDKGLTLVPEVWYGILELVNGEGKSKTIEVGKTLVADNNGSGVGIIFLEEQQLPENKEEQKE